MPVQDIIVYIAVYLIGGLPFAVIVGKLFFHTDVRRHGSGNPGATNTLRVLGPRAGLSVLLLDMSKGILGVLLAMYLTSGHGLDREESMIIGGAAAIAGHIFSPFLRFRGGKGVATTVGAMLALHPSIAGLVVTVFVLVLLISQYVSLSSIVAAFSYVVFILLLKPVNYADILFGICICLLIVVKHKANIQRLLKGEESRFKLRKS
jgi:glycerol-3-phosphate acyltransferase PlsY